MNKAQENTEVTESAEHVEDGEMEKHRQVKLTQQLASTKTLCLKA